MSEELRCLGLLNALEKAQEVPDGLVQLFGEPCIRLAEGIKTYISKVDADIFCVSHWSWTVTCVIVVITIFGFLNYSFIRSFVHSFFIFSKCLILWITETFSMRQE